MINTIIFDVDGTLIDSSPGVKIAVKKTIERYKLQSLTNNELQIFISTSPIQKAFIKFCHVDEATAQKSADEYRRNYINGDLYNAAAYKNIMELLKYLRNKNYKIGIASYKRQDTLDKILSHFELDKYFDAIHGADNNNKLTKKDLINNCLSDLNTRPEETRGQRL